MSCLESKARNAKEMVEKFFPEAHGFSKRFVLKTLEELEARLEDAQRDIETCRGIISGLEIQIECILTSILLERMRKEGG